MKTFFPDSKRAKSSIGATVSAGWWSPWPVR